MARFRLLVIGPGIALIALGCHSGGGQDQGVAKVQAVESPETTNTLSSLDGYVVRTRSADLIALSLPAMQETLIRRTFEDDADSGPTIHSLSGPDSDGRIAYIEDYFFVPDETDRKHMLKTIKIDGTADTEIFSRPGDAMWASHGEIGDYLALAPSGGRVAFLSGLANKQMPAALLNEGQIEIWDVEKKLRTEVTAKAIDQPMSWFPDGKQLAYVKLAPRSELADSAIGLEYFGKYFGDSWDEVPAVYVLDIETGESKFLHVGWLPVVSSDGRTILVGGWDTHSQFSWNRFHVETGESKPIKWPDDAGVVLAVSEQNIVLYRAVAKVGDITNDTPKEMPLSDLKPFAIKAARFDSEKCQTVVRDVDQYDLASFGRVSKKGMTAPRR